MRWTPFRGPAKNIGMASNPHLCCLKRVDPARNMARFYTLSVEPSLFGDAALVRQWGRIGTSGRIKINLYETKTEAETAFIRLKTIKQRRGYEPQTL